jgi:hypothetical protein
MQTRTNSSVLIVILLVLSFPIWIGLLGGLFGIVAGVFGAVFGVIAGIFGAMFGIIGGLFGWAFDWHGPHLFHFGIGPVSLLAMALIIFVVVLVTKKKA